MTQRLRKDGGAGRPARAAGLGPRRIRGAAEPSGPGLSAAAVQRSPPCPAVGFSPLPGIFGAPPSPASLSFSEGS